jgi:IS30 family transposase
LDTEDEKKIKAQESELVKQAAIELLENWKSYLFTLTSDNGKEFAIHQVIATALEVDFYFVKPCRSWNRGANEILNGLIIHDIPKSTSLEEITIERIIQIQEKLNNRMRKTYNFETPNYMFNKKVAFVT